MKAVKSAATVSRTANWRVLIYAKPGTGKTSAIQYMTGKTLVLDLDDSSKVLAGLPNIDIQPFDRQHPSKDLTEFLTNLPERLAGYDNLVIDNISALERDWFVEQGRATTNGIGNEIQDYGRWTNYFTRIISAIYGNAPVNVLLTAWENIGEVTSDTGQTFSQYMPAIRQSVRDELLGLTDVVGRLMINPQTGGRGVILQGSDSIFAKNRLDKRKSTPIADLFKFGGEDDVHTAQVPTNASGQSTSKPSEGK